jgi:hypothetical protein
MTHETRLEIVLHGIRWANNIITEVLSNHAHTLPRPARDALLTATRNLTVATEEIRTVQPMEMPPRVKP